MSKEMLSREEFVKELCNRQDGLWTFLNVLKWSNNKKEILDTTSVDALIDSISDLLFWSAQKTSIEEIHKILNGEIWWSLLSLIHQISTPLYQSLLWLKNKKVSSLVFYGVSANQSLVDLLLQFPENDVKIVTKNGRTWKSHTAATLLPKNLKTAMRIYPPIEKEKVEDQVDNNILIMKETNDEKEEKNWESILSEESQLSSKEDTISQKIELFLKNSDDLTEFCKAEYESEYQKKEWYTLSLFDNPPVEDYISQMKSDIQDNVIQWISMPIQKLYDGVEYDIEIIRKVVKKLYDLTKHSSVQAEWDAINILSLLKFVASFDFTAYKDSDLSFIDIFTQNTVVSDNKNISSLKQSLTIEQIHMRRDIFKKNLQKLLSKKIYTSIVQSVEIKEVVLPAVAWEKIKINVFVNNANAARKFDSDFARYLIYVFAKHLHLSIQDVPKIIDINYRCGNMPVWSKTLFDDYVDNSKYLSIAPIEPHSGNKSAIALMKERIDTQLGFWEVKHVALIGNESTGRTALAKRSISKVLEYLPCLRVKEITGDSFKKDWSTLWKDHYKNNKNTDTINKFNDAYNVDVLIIRDIESLGSATEKAQTKMSELLQQSHMKCILISKNPIWHFIWNFGPDLKKAILGLWIQSQELFQPTDRARKKILNALFRAEKIIIDDELVDIASVCVSSTESYPMLVKTIKRRAKDNKVILNKWEFIQLLRDTIWVVNVSYTLLELDGRLNEYIEKSELYNDYAPASKLKMKKRWISYMAGSIPKWWLNNSPIYFTMSDLASYCDVSESTINSYIWDIRNTYYSHTWDVKNFLLEKINSKLYNNQLFKYKDIS